MIATILALTLTVTAYAPACGGINGSLNNRYADGGKPSTQDTLRVAACGKRFSFGTVLRVHGLESLGVTEVVCRDRGSSVSGVDILVLTGMGCKRDHRDAMEIGRRRLKVDVLENIYDK